MESNKHKTFNESENVKEFLAKVELQSQLKGYTGEKEAQHIASCLEGQAFDVYLRLSDDHRKDAKQVKKELLKAFEWGQRNRDEALQELTTRSRKKDESALMYAYKISELVKLAYRSIEEQAKGIIAKDYFVRGLHPEMQKALKSNEKFSSNDIKALASEVVCLEIASIKSNSATASQTASHVDCVDFNPISTGLFCLVVALGGGGGGVFHPPSITPLSLKLDCSNFVRRYFQIG